MSDSVAAKRYLVRLVDGIQIGPLDKHAVRSMARNGNLKPEDFVSQCGSENWLRAKHVKGLFETSESAPQLTKSVKRSIKVPAQHQGVPKSLVIGLVCMAVAVVVATCCWVVFDQHKHAFLLAEKQMRHAATKEVLIAIDGATAIPASASLDGRLSGLDEALAIADRNYSFITPEAAEQVERLRKERSKIAEKREWLAAAELLLSDIQRFEIPVQVTVPATGLLASDPAKAQRVIEEFIEADLHRWEPLFLGWHDNLRRNDISWWPIMSDLWSVSGKVRIGELIEYDRFFAVLGSASTTKPITNEQVLELCGAQHREFERRLQELEEEGNAAEHDAAKDECIRSIQAALEALVVKSRNAVSRTEGERQGKRK